MNSKPMTAPRQPPPVDPQLAAPLYHQVFAWMRDRIHDGTYGSNTILPSEQELCARFGVSRITVKRALNELAATGMIMRYRGRGTVVTWNATTPVVKGSFDNLLESVRLMGLHTEIELLEARPVAARGEIADLMGVPAGTEVHRALRLRRLEKEPFSWLLTHVPADIAATWTDEELATQPLNALLARAGHEAHEAEQWISARAAEPAQAAALKVMPGAPLLHVQRVMRARGGRVIEVLGAWYRPDRFQYHMTLTRQRGAGRDEWR
jgi:GntR family transcriptional regulator